MVSIAERYASLTRRQRERMGIMAMRARQAIGRREAKHQVKVKSFADKLANDMQVGMAARVKLVGQLLRDKVAINLSRPVTKLPQRRRRAVTLRSGEVRPAGSQFTWVDPGSRSRPGEFPKAETARLRNNIFYRFVKGSTQMKRPRVLIGTTLGYGVLLETRMRRSFLRRTLREELDMVRKILTSGRPGASEPKIFD